MSNDRIVKRRALFLDRDGVINVEIRYLSRIKDCQFIDGVFEVAKKFASAGFAIVIVTNQAGIGRGYYLETAFHDLMTWMRAQFAEHNVEISAVYYCPDHPTEGVGKYRRENPWRKPGPGMLLQAAEDLGLDLENSWCIGDKMTDIEAGRAAGVGTLVLFNESAPTLARIDDYWITPTLFEIIKIKDTGQ